MMRRGCEGDMLWRLIISVLSASDVVMVVLRSVNEMVGCYLVR